MKSIQEEIKEEVAAQVAAQVAESNIEFQYKTILQLCKKKGFSFEETLDIIDVPLDKRDILLARYNAKAN